MKALYEYCRAVMDSTNDMLMRLEYKDLKRKLTKDDRERIGPQEQ